MDIRTFTSIFDAVSCVTDRQLKPKEMKEQTTFYRLLSVPFFAAKNETKKKSKCDKIGRGGLIGRVMIGLFGSWSVYYIGLAQISAVGFPR